MSVREQEGLVRLEGHCPAQEAEDLLRALQDAPQAAVDVGAVLSLHMAVLQVLLALKPSVRGRPPAGLLSQDIFHRLISDGDSGSEYS